MEQILEKVAAAAPRFKSVQLPVEKAKGRVSDSSKHQEDAGDNAARANDQIFEEFEEIKVAAHPQQQQQAQSASEQLSNKSSQPKFNVVNPGQSARGLLRPVHPPPAEQQEHQEEQDIGEQAAPADQVVPKDETKFLVECSPYGAFCSVLPMVYPYMILHPGS